LYDYETLSLSLIEGRKLRTFEKTGAEENVRNEEKARNSATEQLHSVEVSTDYERYIIEKQEVDGLAARKVQVSMLHEILVETQE
jgi:hypothetical protein